MSVPDPFRPAAAFYDGDYEALGWNKDIPFYVEMARECGGPVLEMGCGTGRILLPIARAGIRIHGVDHSPGMLAELQSKLATEPAEVRQRVTFSEGDIRTASVGSRFALVTAPFRVVQLLLKREDQRAWLANVRRHLAPGGALCFDVFQPNFSYLVAARGPVLELERTEPGTGRAVRRFARTSPHNERQTVDVELRWEVEDGGGLKETIFAFEMRWFLRAELESLLELEGFEITDYWGSFAREPFGEGSQEQVVRAVLRVTD